MIRNILRPVKSAVSACPVLCLDGEWEVIHTASIPGAVGTTEVSEGWQKIQVPSDMNARRGADFTGKYVYRRLVELPDVGAGGRLVLKFEGVNGFADIYIDGEKAIGHQNGFVSFDADVTELTRGKKQVLLNVAVDETAERVCSFNHGGLIHSVYLYCFGAAYFDAVYLTTTLDGKYENALLRADISVYGGQKADRIKLTVSGPLGLPWATGKAAGEEMEACLSGTAAEMEIPCEPGENGYVTAMLPMQGPKKWDAEHPYLYRLQIMLIRDGRVLEEAERCFGVRQIERKENRLYVNGREVKLRGVCRHEITPTDGRAVPKEMIREDVRLFKEANCNYIRTSHYSPSEYFLEMCDRFGIYVEDELDLAFIAKSLPYTQRDPAYTNRYLSIFREVLGRDYSHPSVLIWSLANEAFGGYNYDLLNQYAHKMDPTRPTKFSYPMTMQAEHEGIDIWSIHYANVDGEPDKKRDNVSVGYTDGHDVPILNDEYVHIPCYNRTEQRRDPNVRHFWGESLRLFWERIWETKGALGGAIWAGIDETDLFTPARRDVPMTKRNGDTCLEWGIIDIWRRKKPEHYMTRKAYTPFLIRGKTFCCEDGCAMIEVENRFCHTDLSEVKICWKASAEDGKEWEGALFGPKACPRERTVLKIALDTERMGHCPDKLELSIFDADGFQVDEYCLKSEKAKAARNRTAALERVSMLDRASMLDRVSRPDTAGTPDEKEKGRQSKADAFRIREKEKEIWVEGNGFGFYFSSETGLLLEASKDGEVLLTGGPILHVPYLMLGTWQASKVQTAMEEGAAVIRVSGSYAKPLGGGGAWDQEICKGADDSKVMDVTFTIRILPDAAFVTRCRVDRLYVPLPREIKLRVGVDAGGLDELGIAYVAAPGMDTLSWDREGRYTVYPPDHIGRLSGTASRYSKGSRFGEEPEFPWAQEMKNYILNGFYDVDYKGTADFRSLKENIYTAALDRENGKACIMALSDGSSHVRAEVLEPEEYLISDRDERVHYHGTWYPMEDFGGDRNGTETVSCEKGAKAEITFTGTGIVWYGPVDTINGIAKVYLDGKLADGCINQKVAGVDFPGSAAGFDKKYGYPLYFVDGLEYGEHTLCIEVTGEKTKDSQNCYISVDYFRILTGERTEPVKFIVLENFNYPQISWGNYKKEAIRIGDGSEIQVCMALDAKA